MHISLCSQLMIQLLLLLASVRDTCLAQKSPAAQRQRRAELMVSYTLEKPVLPCGPPAFWLKHLNTTQTAGETNLGSHTFKITFKNLRSPPAASLNLLSFTNNNKNNKKSVQIYISSLF